MQLSVRNKNINTFDIFSQTYFVKLLSDSITKFSLFTEYEIIKGHRLILTRDFFGPLGGPIRIILMYNIFCKCIVCDLNV